MFISNDAFSNSEDDERFFLNVASMMTGYDARTGA
jgi:hypothetical protein